MRITNSLRSYPIRSKLTQPQPPLGMGERQRGSFSKAPDSALEAVPRAYNEDSRRRAEVRTIKDIGILRKLNSFTI